MTVVTAAQLANDAREFLRFKRAMGFVYTRAEFNLDCFVQFVESHWGQDGQITLQEAITRWCVRVSGRKAVTVANEFGVVRQLCLYRRRRDPSSFVPEHALAPVKASVFLPYIFSHEEVRRIISAASVHNGRFIWAPMLRALILILYCTGMRLGEAVRLNMVDLDLDRGVVKIQRSKGRERIIAIRADLVEEIQSYLSERRRIVQSRRHNEPDRLFVRQDASALTLASASCAIRRLLRELDMKPETGRAGARPYEFRHAFAVHRLTAWSIEGIDIHAKLPQLSAYLGHQNILGTEVYLLATPQLLELASSRFEDYQRGGPTRHE